VDMTLEYVEMITVITDPSSLGRSCANPPRGHRGHVGLLSQARDLSRRLRCTGLPGAGAHVCLEVSVHTPPKLREGKPKTRPYSTQRTFELGNWV